MNKSKLRREITLFRKKKFQENFKINSEKLIKFLRDNKHKTKIVGGYYPCNHEIDDLEVLNLFAVIRVYNIFLFLICHLFKSYLLNIFLIKEIYLCT